MLLIERITYILHDRDTSRDASTNKDQDIDVVIMRICVSLLYFNVKKVFRIFLYHACLIEKLETTRILTCF